MTANNMTMLVSVIAWTALWGLGGIWLARSAFTMRKNEILMAGLGLGLILENWFANLCAQIVPLTTAIWLSAGLVFLMGLLFSLPVLRRNPLDMFRFSIPPLQVITLLMLVYVFFVIGRGLAILDDYQNLPTAALIATGDIPPHFPLNPDVSYGYHYFTLLLAAQFMRLADLFVWTAVDLARALSFSITILLGALFVQRVTGSKLAGFVGGMMNIFAGGTRWLLLLLPSGLLDRLGSRLSMLGSNAASGQDLTTALGKAWSASGLGPVPFPYAFVNGIESTSVVAYHAGAGSLPGIIGVLLLLTHNKWKGWRAWIVASLLMAALGIANEVQLVSICAGIVLIILVYMAVKRTQRVPQSMWRWLAVGALGGLISLFQGGVLTATALSTLAGWFPGFIQAAPAYHTFSFSFFWPPKVLSSHLGYLSLTDPGQLLILLAEVGPIILLAPLVIVWMVKAFRAQRWYECALALAAAASLLTLVTQMNGASGITALTRVQGMPLGVIGTFGLPALWLWARHRPDVIKTLSAALLSVCMFGGMVLFGLSLIAAPYPVLSDFLERLDASMSRQYFDKLEDDALVFDNINYRAPVVFGRPNRSALDFYTRTEEYKFLAADPEPHAIHAAGYDYIYIDGTYWREMTPKERESFNDSCVRLVYSVEQPVPPDFRRLLDISACE